MAYLLNIAYLAILLIASPWLLVSAIRKGKYREGWAAKLLGRVPQRKGDATCVWLHAVSVGEVNLLAPLILQLKDTHPDWQFAISTTTKTGFDLASKKYSQYTVFYCPLDFSCSVSNAIRRIRPDLLILAELELWPNLIATARRHGTRVAVINGRLSENSARGYGRVRWCIGRILRSIDLIAAQNDDYANRFVALGATVSNVHVTGSMKFDGACTDRANSDTRRLASLAGIDSDDTVFLAGSTQAPEEQLALEAYQQAVKAHPHLRLIIVPRHPDRFQEVAEILDAADVCWQRRSSLPSEAADPAARILLVDAIGELGAWWGTAQIAFVGGSMGDRGGQNMIEPAAYGAAVSFGANTRNFRDIVLMILQHDAGIVVNNGDELTAFVLRCLRDTTFTTNLGRNAQSLVERQIGATRRTCDLIDALISNQQPDHVISRRVA